MADADRITAREIRGSQPWVITVGYRFQPSSRHFVGTVEQKQREVLRNQIQNTYHLFDVAVERQMTPRFSLTGSLPIFLAYRNQLYNPRGEYRVRSIGDMTLGGRAWLFRPPTESGGNVAVGISLKLPTGKYNALGTATDAAGNIIQATADQSIQAGDGGVGFAIDTQAYRPLKWGFMGYFSGSYLFNPRDTNGVSTFRRRRGEEVMSVSDQYLVRGGIAHAVPGVRGLVVTFGGRMEGVPVRDLIGKSNGFRRPGYAISGDPGFLYTRWGYVFSCSVPWAIERNRRRSVTDIANGVHGDAAFADYVLTLGVSKRF
ncbi:MAG: hypothetical protein SFV54_03725 [Bryobacteraceae bacterium]|nr:hypothetical protein [Bryobacteraceae bacterium]